MVDSGATILRLSLNIVPRSVYQTKTVGQEIRARFYVKEMYSGCEVRQDEGSPGGSTNREVREAGSSLPVGELERPVGLSSSLAYITGALSPSRTCQPGGAAGSHRR